MSSWRLSVATQEMYTHNEVSLQMVQPNCNVLYFLMPDAIMAILYADIRDFVRELYWCVILPWKIPHPRLGAYPDML